LEEGEVSGLGGVRNLNVASFVSDIVFGIIIPAGD